MGTGRDGLGWSEDACVCVYAVVVVFLGAGG